MVHWYSVESIRRGWGLVVVLSFGGGFWRMVFCFFIFLVRANYTSFWVED